MTVRIAQTSAGFVRAVAGFLDQLALVLEPRIAISRPVAAARQPRSGGQHDWSLEIRDAAARRAEFLGHSVRDWTAVDPHRHQTACQHCGKAIELRRSETGRVEVHGSAVTYACPAEFMEA